jgi:hypothetical protein
MSNATGGRSTVSDDDLREAVRERTPASTAEIADQVGLTRQGVAYRLKQIEDRWSNPWVWSKKIGPTRVWFHAEHVYPCSAGVPWANDDSSPDGGIDGATKPRRRYRKLTQLEVEQAVYRLVPAGTQEVADLLGTSRQSASYRLKVLVEEESIWAKRVGPTFVWMHPVIMPDPDPDRDTSARHVMSLWQRRCRRRRGKCGKPLHVDLFSP